MSDNPPTGPSDFRELFTCGPMPIKYQRTRAEYLQYWRNESLQQAAAVNTGTRVARPPEWPGMLRLRRVQRDFDRAVAAWQPYQSEVFGQMVHANIEHILGVDYVDCISFVMQKRGWTKAQINEVLVLAYRGCGKSTMLAAAAAAFLKNIPQYSAMVYSGNMRKSIDLIDNIWVALQAMLERDPDFRANFIVRKTSTDISIQERNGHDIRTLRACSSISKNVSQTNSQLG